MASFYKVFFALLLIICSALLIGLWYSSHSPDYLRFPDAMEYAGAARNMTEGEGFSTNTLWVLRLPLSNELPAPEIRRPLLFPFWTFLWFKILGAKDIIAIYASAFWWLAAIILTFLFAQKFFSLKVAVISSFLLIFDKATLNYAFGGLTEPLFTVILLASIWFVLGTENKLRFLAGGIILGLGQWTRTNAFLYIVPVLFIVFCNLEFNHPPCPPYKGGYNDNHTREKKLLISLMFILGFFICILPIFIRNHSAVGLFSLNPLYSYVVLNETPISPAHGMERSLNFYSPFAYFLKNPSVLINKWGSNFIKNFECMGGSLYLIFIGLSFSGLLCLKDKKKKQFLWFTLTSIGLSLIFFSFGEFEGIRFYVPFAPMLMILSVEILFSLKNKMEIGDKPVYFISGLLILLSLILSIQMIVKTNPDVRGLEFRETMGRNLMSELPPDGVILSDIPWATGWYGDRISIWLPIHPEQIPEIEQYIKIDGILLSGSVLGSSELSPRWQQIYMGQLALPDFEKVERNNLPNMAFFVRKK